jgi:hypothetical protein
MQEILKSQDQSNTVLFLGNNDASTDQQVSKLALQNDLTNHGLITDPEFIPISSGYYHTTVVDVAPGLLLLLSQRFDTIVMLDQPQAAWSHWKCLSATFKLMLQLEKLQKHTVFRSNHNSKKILYWTDLVHTKNKSFCIYPWINFNNNGKELKLCARDSSSVTTVEQLQDWATDPNYTAIRKKMLAGTQLHDHCQTCYQYEDLGIESYRQFETIDWVSQLDLESIEDLDKITRPYYYEMSLGNHCNIKCRSCQPAFSKPIGDELKKFNIIPPGMMAWEPGTPSIDQIDIDNLDKKSQVYFQGGEPTIMPEVLEFMERCIEKNKTDFNLNKTMYLFYKHLSLI